MPDKSKTRRIGDWVIRAQRNFIVFIFLLLIIAMLADMGARFFLNKSIFALSDFVGFSSVWLYAIGASYATQGRDHIKAEFINDIVKTDRTRHLFRLISTAISAAMSAVFTKWSYDLCMYSIEIGEVTQGYPVPKIIFQSSFLVGGFLMAVYFFREIIDCYIARKNNVTFIPAEAH
jgi:TRAP-type C4-dicarboxylate transport system permease small subunit